MKYLMVLLLSLTGCGLQRQVNDLKNRSQTNESNIVDLQNRVAILEAQTAATSIQLSGVLETIVGIDATIAALQVDLGNAATQAEVDAIQAQIDALALDAIDNDSYASTLNQQITNNTVAIAILQGYNNIVAIKDPCGAQGAYNEVFLKLSNGRYLSSFSQTANGLNTRFVLLEDGSPVTTDGTNCHFTVSNGGTVISNEHN